MIPVLAIPCISRPDLLEECVASVDAPVAELVVVDNSPEGGIADGLRVPPCVDRLTVLRPLDNLGYSGSINAVLRGRPHLPWWMHANADAVFAPGDMARVEAEMDARAAGPFLCGIRDFRLFGMNAAMLAAVGYWDENYVPVYCEDSDYQRRMSLHGEARYLMLPGDTGHVGSATIQEPRYALRNTVTYRSNRDYYTRKWGGWIGAETLATPFGQGGSVRDWTLDPARLRDNSWTR